MLQHRVTLTPNHLRSPRLLEESGLLVLGWPWCVVPFARSPVVFGTVQLGFVRGPKKMGLAKNGYRIPNTYPTNCAMARARALAQVQV